MRFSLSCSLLSGDLPISLRWEKDGRPLPRDPVLTETHSQFFTNLVFTDIRGRHAGEYTCTASNAAASSSVTATMHVRGECSVAPAARALLGPCSLLLSVACQGILLPSVAVCLLLLPSAFACYRLLSPVAFSLPLASFLPSFPLSPFFSLPFSLPHSLTFLLFHSHFSRSPFYFLAHSLPLSFSSSPIFLSPSLSLFLSLTFILQLFFLQTNPPSLPLSLMPSLPPSLPPPSPPISFIPSLIPSFSRSSPPPTLSPSISLHFCHSLSPPISSSLFLYSFTSIICVPLPHP